MLKDLEKIESVVQEIVTRDELQSLDTAKGYVGFEPSGFLHIGTGLYWTNAMNMAIDSGIEFMILLADWHAYINDKMGGNLENLKKASDYMKEGFRSLGIRDKVKFIYASDVVKDPEYWALLLKVSKSLTIPRVKRALPIMGRGEDDAEKDVSKLIYPLMQATDIFYMDLDVAMGGMDQRHVHMLARDIHRKVGKKNFVAIHGPMISSLKGGDRMDPANKMSKSKANSAIFIHDSQEAIEDKLRGAYCPEKVVEGNPILQIYRSIIFNFYADHVEIQELNVDYRSYTEFEKAYVAGKLHPSDLKNDLARRLNHILEPSREYFRTRMNLLQEMEAMR
jgi:tyrosyl-tRNA synthetase